MEFSPEGYDPALFARMASVEAKSFWFCGRNDLILWAIERFFGPEPRQFLEIGCGTGFVLEAVAARFPLFKLTGAELFLEGLDFARRRVPKAKFLALDAREMPFTGEFDLIGAFDVLEHVSNDRAVIDGIRKALRPGGGVLLTVPQHPWFWSAADTAWHHVRRYKRGELESKLSDAGFEILASTSFMTVLLPLLVVTRLIPHRNTDLGLELPPALNKALKLALDVETATIRAGLRLPLGGSRLVVARKIT